MNDKNQNKRKKSGTDEEEDFTYIVRCWQEWIVRSVFGRILLWNFMNGGKEKQLRNSRRTFLPQWKVERKRLLDERAKGERKAERIKIRKSIQYSN